MEGKGITENQKRLVTITTGELIDRQLLPRYNVVEGGLPSGTLPAIVATDAEFESLVGADLLAVHKLTNILIIIINVIIIF